MFYGGVECTLTILGISHADVGTPSQSEELKGAYSDALKRAAVKFGIGSYLYELKGLKGQTDENNMVIPDSVELPDFALPPENPPSADEKLQPLVENFLSRYNELDTYTRSVLKEITSFGKYNSSAPLIVKKAVYEHLELIK